MLLHCLVEPNSGNRGGRWHDIAEPCRFIRVLVWALLVCKLPPNSYPCVRQDCTYIMDTGRGLGARYSTSIPAEHVQ